VHTMTKLFVALGALLSVALATLSMTYMVNADRLSQALRQSELQIKAAETAQTATIAELRGQLINSGATIQALQQDIAARESELTSIAAKLGESRTELASLQLRSTIDAATSTYAVQTAEGALRLADSIDRDNKVLLAEESERRIEFADLQQRFSEISNQVIVLTEELDRAQINISQLQQQLAQASPSGAPAGTGQSFSARVTRVSVDNETGNVFIGMNIGRAERLTPNTVLEIRRANAWIADVRVTEVDVNSSVGVVTSLAGGESIRERDTVVVGGR